VSWAIVIGIDHYRGEHPDLNSAVYDAVRFSRWLREEAGLPQERIWRLLGRRTDGRRQRPDRVLPTKDNVVNAINEVLAQSGGEGEALYFYFSGHGLTTTYANREESALVFPGIDSDHPSQTLAVRSIAEFFETTRFLDQFFFIDACRNRLDVATTEIGAWPIPRRRQPGQDPAQQFILYATSPGRTAQAGTWKEENSAFTKVLMAGLKGRGQAKAWSWARGTYEVRWDRLATYVVKQMERKQAGPGGESYSFQIPQDVGIRGVAARDRDPLLARPRAGGVKPVKLRLDLAGASGQEVDVTVFDAIGVAVANAVRVTRRVQEFTLPPRTYSVRLNAADRRVGRIVPPVIELYQASTPEIDWRDEDDLDQDEAFAPGSITIRSPDPFAVADIRDETGRVAGIATPQDGREATPGFYRVRLVGPERDKTAEEAFVLLKPKEVLALPLPDPAVNERTAELAEVFGGRVEAGYVTPAAGASPAAWAQPSTIVAAGIGAALHGEPDALGALQLDEPPTLSGQGAVVVFVAVRGTSDPAAKSVERLRARIWAAGEPVPERLHALGPTPADVATVVVGDLPRLERCWLSIEAADEKPTVVALNPLKGRLAVVVAQVDQDRTRLYQFHPVAHPDRTSTPDRMRRLEYLQRQLLGGRLDGARSIALGPRSERPDDVRVQVAAEAKSDPFGSCVVGYMLLRLGLHEWLGGLASAIIEAEPTLSDAYILRGEYEAHRQNTEASRQAYADAVSAGIPAFGEGLTRLVEGLLASGLSHPRGALVRYIFQRHVRGSMWAAFTPRGAFEPGRLVITGSDIGYEG
jgi:Caspase domain